MKMGAKTTVVSLICLISSLGIEGNILTSGKGPIRISQRNGLKAESNALEILVGPPKGSNDFLGWLGLALPESVGLPGICEDNPPGQGDDVCFGYGDYAKLTISAEISHENPCMKIEWSSAHARRLEDCYEIASGMHWYGGGETFTQRWPIERDSRKESPFITGDHLNNGSYYAGGVLEKYWLVSNGIGFFFDDEVPLHFSMNAERPGKVCFIAQDDHPYTIRSPLKMSYTICSGENILDAHKTIASKFFRTPEGTPSANMMANPVWSTWAQFHQGVNQSLVLDYARRIVSEGYVESSHVEIDDKWEACYGEETFDPVKFPDPKAMVDEIKSLGLKVTVWVHPFVNQECPLFREGLEKGYFVKDQKGKTGLSSWWAGSTAGVIDVTNPEAVKWWHDRLRKLQEDIGIDGFKFDAGESNWLPYHPMTSSGNPDLMPNLYTKNFVEACSEFWGLTETRTAHRNQNKALFIRMMDKDSTWSYGNGLKSLIPTLLHFGILGYPFVLPDMVGGNAYGGRPDKELYIRWIQANVLMPAVQFSIPPWDFDDETQEIVKKTMALRKSLEIYIIIASYNSYLSGYPMNEPLWWLDPEDKETYTIDSEYTLQGHFIAAPVLEKGARSRDIYLPKGNWTRFYSEDGPWETEYVGPIWLRDFPVGLDEVPVFARTDEDEDEDYFHK